MGTSPGIGIARIANFLLSYRVYFSPPPRKQCTIFYKQTCFFCRCTTAAALPLVLLECSRNPKSMGRDQIAFVVHEMHSCEFSMRNCYTVIKRLVGGR